MRDAELRREFHRLCRKRPGTLSDDERSFKAFKAGVEYMSGVNTEDIFEQLTRAASQQAQREEWEG